ncbi:DNA-directed RNA polymerase subunit beta [Hordeum vulgare]|nr:DNA-directed RNA polymerase subunit beta [Hordeum vulgare]
MGTHLETEHSGHEHPKTPHIGIEAVASSNFKELPTSNAQALVNVARSSQQAKVEADATLAGQVIDMGLQMINSVIEPAEVVPNAIGVDLVLVGELRDHHVVGVESMFHHPLALEDLLLHCFEPRLYASGLLGPLNIMDVQHPLRHLDRLRVLQNSRKVGIDDLLEELAFRAFGDAIAI